MTSQLNPTTEPVGFGIVLYGPWDFVGARLPPGWTEDADPDEAEAVPLWLVARVYAERGLAIFPVDPKSKRPLTEHGHLDATTDADRIETCWRRWPNAGIGNRPAENEVVIDIDRRNGGDKSFDELTSRLGVLPATVTTETPNGTHLRFRLPLGISLPKEIAPGVDLKGHNGYVILPPGPNRRWAEYGDPEEQNVAELPAAWLEAIKSKSRSANGPAPPLPEKIKPGARHSLLTSLAGSMRRRNASEAAILAALEADNRLRCQPPLDAEEVRSIAASVARYPAPAEQAATPSYLSLPTLDDVLVSMAPPGERLTTGIPTLDRVSRGGFARGCVYTFIGPPGAGKTAMLCQLARRFADKYGALVIGLFFDEGAWQAALMTVEGLGFERGDLESDYASIRPKVAPKTAKLDIRLPRPADADTVLDSIDGWLASVDTRERRIVLAIDSAQTARVSRDEKPATRKDHADAVMSKARAVAQWSNAVVLLASKANRASWSHKDPAENLDSLAAGLDSSSIEYASDALFFMSRDQGQLVVCKNRPGDGTSPTIAMEFHRDRASFTEVDKEMAKDRAEEVESERVAAKWSADEAKVLKGLRRYPGRSQRALRPLMGVASSRLGALIEELSRKGRIEKRDGGWHVIEGGSGDA